MADTHPPTGLVSWRLLRRRRRVRRRARRGGGMGAVGDISAAAAGLLLRLRDLLTPQLRTSGQ